MFAEETVLEEQALVFVFCLGQNYKQQIYFLRRQLFDERWCNRRHGTFLYRTKFRSNLSFVRWSKEKWFDLMLINVLFAFKWYFTNCSSTVWTWTFSCTIHSNYLKWKQKRKCLTWNWMRKNSLIGFECRCFVAYNCSGQDFCWHMSACSNVSIWILASFKMFRDIERSFLLGMNKREGK